MCAGFSVPKTETVYFTIHAGERIYKVTDELLRGGWWNEQAQKEHRGGRTLFEKAADSCDFQKDFPDIWRLVQRISRDVERRAYDGHVQFHPGARSHHERFTVTGAQSGYDLDEERLCQDILGALKSGSHKVITAKIKVKQPRAEQDVISKLGFRGGYTTYFEPNPCRQHNIELALRSFNGLSVRSGETVSFNKVVGPRTRARGYQEAKIILCGEFVPGVGGGVCQASTTLFNALLLAGLKIDKSYNHSRAISYVPIGRDAMVSSAADLRFTNNTGGTVYIETGVNPACQKSGSAWVRIYGNKTGIRYKPKTVVTESELGEDEVDPARQSRTYIEAWSGDRLVHSKLVRKSKYNAVKRSNDPA